MKTLFLIRHAKSSWGSPELADIERLLNERGERDAPEMGRRLATRGVKPDILVSSPARRAYTTAQLIATEIDYPEDKIRQKPELYYDGNYGMMSVIHWLPPEASIAMLFSHNPTITETVNALANAMLANMPTCGVAEIQFDVKSWDEVKIGAGKMQLFDYPKRVEEG